MGFGRGPLSSHPLVHHRGQGEEFLRTRSDRGRVSHAHKNAKLRRTCATGICSSYFFAVPTNLWHAEMHDREIDQVIETRRPIRGEVPFKGTNGRRVYDYIFTPVLSLDGSVQAVAGTTPRRDRPQTLRGRAEGERLIGKRRVSGDARPRTTAEIRSRPSATPSFMLELAVRRRG